jgi:hypothetical protein
LLLALSVIVILRTILATKHRIDLSECARYALLSLHGKPAELRTVFDQPTRLLRLDVAL